MEKQIVQVTADKISKLTGFTVEQIAVVKNTVAKGTTDTELAYFLSVAKTVELSPFNKEIWCYKDNRGNVIVLTGRDGFLKKAQSSPLWNGITSFSVHKNDKFSMDISDGHVKISHQPNFAEPGEILGAYAIAKPKGVELPTIEWAKFSTYNKGQFVWKSHPDDMIKKVAEVHALRKAYGITGLQSEYDFDVKNGIVTEIEPVKSDIEILTKNVLEALDEYDGEDKEDLKNWCAEKQAKNEFTKEFGNSILRKIGAL